LKLPQNNALSWKLLISEAVSAGAEAASQFFKFCDMSKPPLISQKSLVFFCI
jgi:hypothetical protein